jgi:transposase, IS4 family
MPCPCQSLDLQDRGKKVKRFYGDRAYDANEVHNTGVEVVVPPRENASTRRGHPAGRKAVREFKELGYNRWREGEGVTVLGGGLSPCSLP